MKNLAKNDEVLYHIGLSRKIIENAAIVLLPGDPGRVEALARGIGPAKFLASHREYTSWLAELNGAKILVCSTGMGGPSVAICVEELARIGLKKFIRVGTTGAIQENIELGDLIINKASVRLEGTSSHYAPIEFPAVASLEITNALVNAAKEVEIPYHIGISISSDTFWPGQERYDSYSGYVPRRFQGSLKEWRKLGATNYEMEAATLFVTAEVFGLQAGAICGVIAKRTESESIAPKEIYNLTMERFFKVLKQTLSIFSKEGL